MSFWRCRRWQRSRLKSTPARLRLWTDDYSSLLPILNLRAEPRPRPESKAQEGLAFQQRHRRGWQVSETILTSKHLMERDEIKHGCRAPAKK